MRLRGPFDAQALERLLHNVRRIHTRARQDVANEIFRLAAAGIQAALPQRERPLRTAQRALRPFRLPTESTTA